jgi:hypothetical protein
MGGFIQPQGGGSQRCGVQMDGFIQPQGGGKDVFRLTAAGLGRMPQETESRRSTARARLLPAPLNPDIIPAALMG